MSKTEKLYQKIKNNPKDVSFEELSKLLTKFGGFECRQPNGGSSHYTFTHSEIEDIITIPKDRPIKRPYVISALRALDQVKNSEG